MPSKQLSQKQKDKPVVAQLVRELRQRYGDTLSAKTLGEMLEMDGAQVNRLLQGRVDSPTFMDTMRLCMGLTPPLLPNQAARLAGFDVPVENARVSPEEAQFLTLLHHPSLTDADRQIVLEALRFQIHIIKTAKAERGEPGENGNVSGHMKGITFMSPATASPPMPAAPKNPPPGVSASRGRTSRP